MRGRVGLVIGLAAGYVLGTRAGRERYEQIKEQARKVCELPVVRAQTEKLKQAGKSAALAVPTALWDGAVKVVRAAGAKGTAGQKLDAAVAAGKQSMGDVADAAEKTADAVEDALRDRDGS